MKYLVIFTTPVEGGWKPAYVDAMAIVENDHETFSMPANRCAWASYGSWRRPLGPG